MSLAAATIWVALILALGTVTCVGLWTFKTWIEYRYCHLIEITKAVRRRAPLTGHVDPENFFDLAAEQERDARNRRGAKPFVAVDNSEPPPKGAA